MLNQKQRAAVQGRTDAAGIPEERDRGCIEIPQGRAPVRVRSEAATKTGAEAEEETGAAEEGTEEGSERLGRSGEGKSTH